MMKRVLRTLGAVSVVSTSMALGVILALVYAWLLAPMARDGVVPVRLDLPLGGGNARGGEASKAAIFDELEVQRLYERAAPAVVLITRRAARGQGLGSGVIVDANGIVLTNYHVVRGNGEIEVAVSDRTQYAGRVLGADPQNDLAVLQLIDAPGGLPAVAFGDSTRIKPGALAVAIGNPAGLERSITVGVVSGVNRTLPTPERPLRDIIQTDAAINPGNSGGPLLDSRGELIGINTAIEAVSGQRGFGGIGYAVPASTAQRYLERMVAGETIVHPWIGVRGQDLTPALARQRGATVQSGVAIEEAMTGGPALAAGVLSGDVLVSLAGEPIRSMDELGDRLDKVHRAGETVVVGVARGAQRLELSVTLAPWPERLPAAPR
jgi:S1-C subfamily serine protease